MIAFIITAFLIGGGVYYFLNKRNETQKNDLQNQISNLQKQAAQNNSVDQSNTGNSIAADTSSWAVYSGKSAGYTLKYPKDWKLSESDVFDENKGGEVRYITLNTPDSRYLLHFGLKKTTDTFATTDRTATGPGSLVNDGTLKILSTLAARKNLVYKNQIKDVSWQQAVYDTAAYRFDAYFSIADATIYDSADLAKVSYVQTAAAILQSVQLTK